MTTFEQRADTGPTCPVVNYSELNTDHSDALWHFDNFDRKREEAPIFVA